VTGRGQGDRDHRSLTVAVPIVAARAATMIATVLAATMIATALAAAMMAMGCGGAPPPPAAEPPKEEVHEVKPQLRTSSELGTVDPDAVQRAFHGLDDKFSDCQKQGLGRVEVLAGSIKFFLRIGSDGSAKWTYLEESDLGDRDTEKCLLDAVQGGRWPKPDGGGDAEARYTMEFSPLGRPATSWGPDRVAPALGKAGDAIDQCKGGASGFRGTVYVGPGGKVLAAGVATASKDAAGKADCVAKVLGKMKGLPSPGSWPAKVTFGL
jgi:hypothetical protein